MAVDAGAAGARPGIGGRYAGVAGSEGERAILTAAAEADRAT
jgi:hypothetical protein